MTTEPREQPEEDIDRERLIADALGTYSADGQADDVTGGDAGAEEKFGHDVHPRGTSAEHARPSPQGPRTGPA